MVIIAFRTGATWHDSNWVYRQLLADVVEMYPGDAELKDDIEKGEAIGTLFLDSMEDARAAKVLDALQKVADETVHGKLPGWKNTRPDDVEGQQRYLQAMARLLRSISP
jgi:hypothetical protein